MLHYSTYVAPSKPAVSDDLPPGELRRMWSPTAATLIYGERDAILVDPLMTAAEGEDLAGWIAASGKNLTTIFVTHGHGDHFFGAAPVLDRFPNAKMVATSAVVEGMKKQLSPVWLDGFWRARFPGQLPERLFVAEPLEDGTFMLEGQALMAVDLGHTDTDGSAALHVPSIGLVVAGDSARYRWTSSYTASPAWWLPVTPCTTMSICISRSRLPGASMRGWRDST